ncbi:Metal-pseudopaline receptor CntO [Dyadobacter sp. CECT 9623]|uniref:Metal-pseudopaline receptor CntO n=1 Tax=Dyadobacter linearis TaxID=2823330 RepID=A0ABN7RAQ6_9BACT|nr:TonB-dependent receptor [Dyadobacter sp. CECT 9623]CAG5070208.1 Metal-pseudopaline receptor CntO [Dyadobacter sp. CECT 9623]
MRIPSLLFFFILTSFVARAQTGTIKGQIKTAAGTPAEYINIILKGTGKGTVTSSTGEFEFNALADGTYQLIGTGVGIKRIDQTVSLKSGEIVNLELTAAESAEELQTLEILGRKETTYKNDLSFIASKTATPIKEVPQAISYITKEVMRDQGTFLMGDAVKNMSGVNQFTFYDDLTIRGFRMNGGSTTQLVNGLRTFSGFWKQPPVNYLERVEVIKGAASALYGNTSPGGTINRVTKKPLDTPQKSLSFTTGSYNTLRMLADFTGPMNEKKTLLYRLNVGYNNAQSFRNLQFDKNIIVAPSVSFLPTEKTRINFDMVYNRSNSRLDRGQSVKGNDLYSSSIKTSLNAVNDYLNEETYLITTSLNHQFTQYTSFNIAYLRTGYTEDLLEHRSSNVNAVDSAGAPIQNLVARQVFVRKTKSFMDNVSLFFNHNFNTGIAEHKLVAGYDYIQSSTPKGSGQQTANGYLLKAGGAAAYNAKQPERFVFYNYTENGVTRSIPKPNISHYDLTLQNNNLEDPTKYTYNVVTNASTTPVMYQLHGLYLQEQLKINRLQILLGLRYDTYIDKKNYTKNDETNVTQHALLPRIGAVYTLTNNVNIYGTYTKGYNPQDAVVQSDPLSGGPFDPIRSSLAEAGLKTEWLDGRLTANASFYQIVQTNTLYSANAVDNPNLMQQIGEEKAKGVEFDVTGNILPNWNLIVAYSYNDAKITDAGSRAADQVLVNLQKPNAPKNQGSIWTKYTFVNAGLNGLGLGLGSNYVGERNLSINNAQIVPAYTLLNAAIYYKIDKFQFQVNLNNVTNKTYWVGGYDYLRLFPGTPRNFLATIAYTF